MSARYNAATIILVVCHEGKIVMARHHLVSDSTLLDLDWHYEATAAHVTRYASLGPFDEMVRSLAQIAKAMSSGDGIGDVNSASVQVIDVTPDGSKVEIADLDPKVASEASDWVGATITTLTAVPASGLQFKVVVMAMGGR